MCGTEVWQIAFGRFVEHAGCAAAFPRTGGLLRCCRGTLDFAPMGGYLSVVADDGMLDRIIAEGVGPRPSSRRKGRRAGRRASGPRPAHTTGQTRPSALLTLLLTRVGVGPTARARRGRARSARR